MIGHHEFSPFYVVFNMVFARGDWFHIIILIKALMQSMAKTLSCPTNH
jgi:hypothetical protein